MGQPRKRKTGIRKVCGCARSQWTRCRHGWHFALQYKGATYRYSFASVTGNEVTSETEAETAYQRVKLEIKDGTFRRPGETPVITRESLTLRGLLDVYKTRVVEGRGDVPTAAYVNATRVICRTPVPTLSGASVPLGDWLASDVNTEAIEAFQFIRGQAGKVAANRNLEILRLVCGWAASKRRRLLDESPFTDGPKTAIKMFPELPRSRRLRVGEGESLVSVAGEHLRAIIECALETGCRKGEILSLQWSQVRWTPKAHLFLPAAKTKTRTDRTIPMSSRLKAILEMRRTDAAGEAHPPEAYVFGTTTGERVLGFKRAWQTAVLKAHGHEATYVKGANLSPASRAALRGIDLHFHDLRREAGSRWMDAGVPLHQIQHWLGHTNISQTSTYLAATTLGAEEAMARFDQARGATPAAPQPGQPEASTENLQESCKENSEIGGPRWDRTTDPLVKSH